MRMKKWVEYWITPRDENLDSIELLIQGNSKKRALRKLNDLDFADYPTAICFELERVDTWGNDWDGVCERKYEIVAERIRPFLVHFSASHKNRGNDG